MRLLREGGVRLLTFTGSPGVGKTCLAAQVAEALRPDYPDGPHLARLGSTRDPLAVPSIIARAMGITAGDGRQGWDALARALHERSTLLMLDNLEQVIVVAPFLADLLAACPKLAVLATSRAPLRVRGEQQFPTAPLALPPSGPPLTPDALRQAPAVALFLAVAQAVRLDFALTAANADDIAAICHQLDGLPLAIEFAAARVRTMPPELLRTHLSGTALLDWLADGRRDRPGRHHTMRRAIGWSYNLLTARGQAAFQILALFPDGASPHALAAVLAAEPANDGDASAAAALDELVDQGLALPQTTAGAVRFTIPNLPRAYALDRLAASDEGGALRAQFAAHGASLVARNERDRGDLATATGPESQNPEAARERAVAHRDTHPARHLAATHALPLPQPNPDPQRARPSAGKPLPGTPPLSPREREVLALIAQGHSNKRIAHTLYISESTAKYHVRSLLDKLGADTRAQAGLRGLL